MNDYLKSIAPCDIFECDGAASFLQSGFWGIFKQQFLWQARGFTADWGSFGKTPLLVITRPITAGFCFAYVPFGPELPENFPAADDTRCTALAELVSALKHHLPSNTAFIRFDPPWFSLSNEEPPRICRPFVRAAADIQPPDTVILDISPPPEAIMAQMKSKWRYNIRLGGKNINVRRADYDGLDCYYGIFKETARRDGIAIHGIDYYRALFELALSYNVHRESGGLELDVRLYLAYHGGKAIAGIITLFRGKTATYLYGASSNDHRSLMAPYALQWQAILDAKEKGCTGYDLFGIPPTQDPNHPMAGLYRFKTGFGGSIIHRAGSWDYPNKPAVTKIFNRVEKFRKLIRDLKKR